MEWIKSMLATFLEYGDFVAQVLVILCFTGVFYVLEQVAPTVTLKHKLIIFVLIMGLQFWGVVKDVLVRSKKEQAEAKNKSVLTFTLTSQDANSVQINSTLVAGDNIPHWGNHLLKQGQDLLTGKYKQLERKETNND